MGTNLNYIEIGKIPPQAIDLEEAVLCCCMLDENAIFETRTVIKTECFYKEINQKIFSCMIDLCDECVKIDLLTLTDKLRKKNILDEVGGPFNLAQLSNIVSTTTNLKEYAKIVYQKYVQRELIRIFQENSNKAFDDMEDPVDIIETVNSELSSLIDLRGNSVVKIKHVIDNVYERIDHNTKQTQSMTGIPSGLTKLDRHTNGFQKTDLVVIAGETSQGKTSLALQICRAGVYGGFKGAFYSLEMSPLQLGARLLSQETGISSKHILMEKLGVNEYQQIDERMIKLYNSEIYIDEKCTTKFSDILNSIRLMKLRIDIDFIIIDYIQLIKNGLKGKTTADEVGDVVNTLKRAARDLNICIIALSQLTRDLNPIPTLRRLKQSGDIENAADTIIFPYRPEAYQNAYWFNSIDHECESMEGKAQIITAKGRNIGTDEFICNFNPQLTLFYDLQSDLIIPNNKNFYDVNNRIEPDKGPF